VTDSSPINMSGMAGKVALVNTTTPLGWPSATPRPPSGWRTAAATPTTTAPTSRLALRARGTRLRPPTSAAARVPRGWARRARAPGRPAPRPC
jgi:hypothetical protein